MHLKEAERIYKLNKKLYEQKAIGSQEFKQSENNYNYQLQKKKLTEQILKQDSVSAKQQVRHRRSNPMQGSQNALECNA